MMDTKGVRWVMAWKCQDCGKVMWGEYVDGPPHDRSFCNKCGGPVVLGAAQVEGTEMEHDAPFKPSASSPESAAVATPAFICSHCGAPNGPKEGAKQ
jgi:hypothetical protein